tara:strand:+ start:666 stop:791 length:126 start_codon:yes stop_codon:yes gene_type:complete
MQVDIDATGEVAAQALIILEYRGGIRLNLHFREWIDRFYEK